MCRIMSNKSLIACHLICKVIDFFGDIGVAWRIAKQLKVDFNIEVHLLVDDLMTSRRLIPSLDISLKKQTVDGITIHHCDFSEDSKSLPPPPAFVFNLFNIDLPNAYKLLMQSEKSKYIAIEYLSAEPWVENFHLKPSIDPESGLIKTFFYPGFTCQTGGLIREKDLLSRRESFVQANRDKFIKSFGGNPNLYSISLFYYPIQKIEAFLDVMELMKKPIQFFIPQYLFDLLKVEKNYQYLHIISYPFLSHDDFDDLLRSCNLNFVRGEDSWIRAIWAGKPFIWQPYIQENSIHLIKLKAFLKSYCEDCEQELSEVLFKMHDDWSNNKFNEALWLDFFKNQSSLESFALKRSHRYFKEPSFVESLVDYCSET
ncbi:elongation factor P maturation arginine rhamnosyltransferase EarP [Candidatus Methylopumilus universalis]|nr:elongation factor P maturation arginine rhamnosyltransferase EarP [Candidatus Methylopumilus universalis]